jgi:peptidoglycan hydrolase CwlO-like protein
MANLTSLREAIEEYGWTPQTKAEKRIKALQDLIDSLYSQIDDLEEELDDVVSASEERY